MTRKLGKIQQRFVCIDCGVLTYEEYYMVHPDIWFSVVDYEWRQYGDMRIREDGDVMLCIGCLESRLGRKLNKEDFTDAPLNTNDYTKSQRLLDRLAA